MRDSKKLYGNYRAMQVSSPPTECVQGEFKSKFQKLLSIFIDKIISRDQWTQWIIKQVSYTFRESHVSPSDSIQYPSKKLQRTTGFVQCGGQN